MSNKIIFSYDFEKIDNDLLNHISILYLNDVIAFLHLTNVIAYSTIIEESIVLVNKLPENLRTMSFALNSAAALLNNLFTADIIKESKIQIKDDVLPNLVLQPLLSNLISNYKIIPYINKTKYFQFLQQHSDMKNIDNILNIIYESCNQFATDGEIKL